MLGRLMPREEKFFDLFRESADQILKGSREFQELLNEFPRAESRARAIKDIEHRADEITHQTVELLHKTFITPLDREDIFALISKMDDILDFIDAAAQRIYLFDIKKMPQEMKGLADVCSRSAEHVKQAVAHLDQIKKPEEIMKHCIEINRLENEADHLMRSGVARLFREEPDLRELIKLKEVFELLETVTDRCEDVANIIEGIVLEYA
jgi:predicted phosphate transport protein (TIGR00153 family)